MPKPKRSTINDIGTLLILVLFVALLVWSFRQQIVSGIEKALVELAVGLENALIQLAIGIGILILALIPFGIGFYFMQNYVDNETAKGVCFVFSIIGLWVLSGWAIGYYISIILSLFLLGILGYFGWEAVKDLF